MIFLYAPSREHRHVGAFLGEFEGTLVSDGYEVYAAYARDRDRVIKAGCWSHCARAQAAGRSWLWWLIAARWR